jgi:hypothetical protein
MRVHALLSAMIVGFGAVSAGAQVLPASFEVVDANNLTLGPVVDGVDFSFPEAPVVTFSVAGHAILAAVTADGRMFTPATSGTVDAGAVYFASVDCSGPAYLRQWVPDAIWEPQAIVGLDNRVYLGSLVAPQALAFNSVLRASSACSAESALAGAVIPATLLQAMTPPYQAPFRLSAAAAAAAVPGVSPTGLAILAVAVAIGAFVLLRR